MNGAWDRWRKQPLPHLPKAKEPTLMEKYAVAAAAELRASYRAAPYYLKLPVVKQSTPPLPRCTRAPSRRRSWCARADGRADRSAPVDVERYSTRYAAKDEPSSALAAVQTGLAALNGAGPVVLARVSLGRSGQRRGGRHVDLSTFPEELRTATSNDKRVRPGATATFDAARLPWCLIR